MYEMGVLCNKYQTGDVAMCRSAYIYYCNHTPPRYYTGTCKVVGINTDTFYAKYAEKLNANYIMVCDVVPVGVTVDSWPNGPPAGLTAGLILTSLIGLISRSIGHHRAVIW